MTSITASRASASADLLDRICTEANLTAAWQRVARKGARGGIDTVSVAEFSRRADQRLAALRAELQSGSYVPEPFEQIGIPKLDSPGETRILKMPTVRDKVAQEAVRAVIAPILEKTFVDCSYAYRPGKGPAKALRRVEHHLAAKRRWIAAVDVDRFFDCIDHDLMVSQLRRHIPDERVVRLLELWVKMGSVTGRGVWVDPQAGVAQGNITSPLLSNVYLTPFDRHVTERGDALVRYADDLLLLSPTKGSVEAALTEARRFLRTELRLTLNPAPDAVRSLDQGFVFLGIQFDGQTRRIADAKMAQLRSEVAQLCRRSLPLGELVTKLNESVGGWRRYYGTIDPQEQFRQLDAVVAAELAKRLIRQPPGNQANGSVAGQAALDGLQMLSATTAGRRRHAIAAIAHKAKAMRGRRPKLAARNPIEPNAGAAVGAETAVARRKRRYLREAVSSSELVLSEPGVFLGKTSRRMVVKKHKRLLLEIPLDRLRHVIVAAPGATLSAAAITHCAQHKIPIDFLSFRGDPLARLQAPLNSLGHPGLRQLHAVHDGSGLQIARAFVRGKLKNQLNLVKYYHKYWKRVDAEFAGAFDEIEVKFDALLAELKAYELPLGDYEAGRHRLFAFEGQGAGLYWRMVELLLDDDVEFRGRERQGATDLVNALLNYGYGMLYPRILHALELAGLNPCVSFLHSFQGDKPTLSFDLIEEFRPQAIDRAVFSLITKGEKLAIDPAAGRLTRETVSKVAQRVAERLSAPVTYRGNKRPLEEVIRLQAKRLAAALDKRRQYQPFIMRW